MVLPSPRRFVMCLLLLCQRRSTLLYALFYNVPHLLAAGDPFNHKQTDLRTVSDDPTDCLAEAACI
jgi:hypothetical protein